MLNATSALAFMALSSATLPAVPKQDPAGMAHIKGGSFLMGSNDPSHPEEGPVHKVTLSAFYMDKTEVTVGQFKKFVHATGYKTQAEINGFSVCYNVKTDDWDQISKASWRQPRGPKFGAAADDWPAVHVTLKDCQAYAGWAGKSLPTEAQWEYAARAGLEQKRFPWGDTPMLNDKAPGNFWQGDLKPGIKPIDGFSYIAPVGSFKASPFGLSDMGGNVWEWVSDRFDADYYSSSAKLDPHGPSGGDEGLSRGGSWRCSPNYCCGFRAAARNPHSIEFSADTLGFRCVLPFARANRNSN